jgi:tetratricopeptide (TPR) repeat protein
VSARGAGWSAALLLLLLGAFAPAQAPQVARQPSAEAQLAHARRCKQALRDSSGAERERRRRVAVAAYLAVERFWPRDRQRVAEATFRAGELLRSGGDDAAALPVFERARITGRGTDMGVRAALEIGHLLRRAREDARALATYLDVWTEERAARERRDEAALWAGRVLARDGRLEEARSFWTRLARDARDPVTRIAAWDELALAHVDEGDLEAAAGELAACRDALHDVAQEETRLGRRVQSALVNMRVIGRLERAVEARARDVQVGGN